MADVKLVFCGRKPYAVSALKYVLYLGWQVQAVVVPSRGDPTWMPRPMLSDFARAQGLPLRKLSEVNDSLQHGSADKIAFDLANTDLVISYLFPYRITDPLLSHGRLGAINFHPAPLPEFGGLRGYNFAILERSAYYGCTCHFMDEEFDSGDIVKVRKFKINPDQETAFSLEKRAQREMLFLFRDICDMINSDMPLPRIRQAVTKHISRRQFEAAKQIHLNDSAELVERKIRAFFYPPYQGAKISIGSAWYTLVSEDLLDQIAVSLHSNTDILDVPPSTPELGQKYDQS